MKIINYDNQVGLTCNFKMLSNILKYYGYDIPEEYVSLLLCDKKLLFPDINLPFISDAVLREVGCKLDIMEFKDERQFYDLIKSNIDKGRPIILNVNPYELPYFPETINYELENNHGCVVHGYKKGYLLMSDAFVPFYPPENFTGWVDEKVILNAVMTSSDSNKLFIMILEKRTNIDYKYIANKYLKTYIHMLIKENAISENEEKKKNKIFEIKDNPESVFFLLGEANIKKIVKRKRLEWLSYNGAAQSRLFLAKICESLSGYNSYFKHISVKFEKFHKQWITLANCYLKFSITMDPNYFFSLSNQYLKLLKDEMELMNEVIINYNYLLEGII